MVPTEHVAAVLLWLIKERVLSATGVKAWLDANAIPSSFDSWIRPERDRRGRPVLGTALQDD
jgi:hypothetical protein